MKTSVIECDKELYTEIATKLQFAIVGKPIFYSDTLADLIRRHCPELYDIAKQAGFRFIPSVDKNDLYQTPPAIWFDIVNQSPALI